MIDWNKVLQPIASEPIDIILVTYQRSYFLERVLKEIYQRTFYPYRLIVVDNASTDDTKTILKRQEKLGRIRKAVYLPQNVGQCQALNEGFKYVESEYFITTQDDLIPPLLRPCWLERLLYLIKKYEPDYGAICMRIQRTRRLEWSESEDLIDNYKSMPSVFRIQRRDLMEQLGDRPFGRLKHWESHVFAESMKKLKKKFAMATHLYADHIGFMPENKGYRKGFTEYLTYSKERVKQGEDKPYPDIDQKTNIPTKMNHPVDTPEFLKRLRRKEEVGWQEGSKHTQQKKLLSKYCKGIGLDIGCGKIKISPNAIGVDLFPEGDVDVVASGDDLWMFKDNSLDFVVASHSLEHFPDTKRTLKEWDRVLKPGGVIAFIVPDGELRPRTILEKSHKVALTKPVLVQLLKRFLGYRRIVVRNLTEFEGPKIRGCIFCYAEKPK